MTKMTIMNIVHLSNGKIFETEDPVEKIRDNLQSQAAFAYISDHGLYLTDVEFDEIMFEPFRIENSIEKESDEWCKFFSDESDREWYNGIKYGSFGKKKKKK